MGLIDFEVLPAGTVERECAERGERVYQLADLDELLQEFRDSGETEDLIGIEEAGAILIERAVSL